MTVDAGAGLLVERFLSFHHDDLIHLDPGTCDVALLIGKNK